MLNSSTFKQIYIFVNIVIKYSDYSDKFCALHFIHQPPNQGIIRGRGKSWGIEHPNQMQSLPLSMGDTDFKVLPHAAPQLVYFSIPPPTM